MLTFLSVSTTPGYAQVTTCLAAWVAETGASSFKIQRLCPDGAPRHEYSRQIGLNSADENPSNLLNVNFRNVSELANALTAPCSRRGLECRLEHGPFADAVVMHRLP